MLVWVIYYLDQTIIAELIFFFFGPLLYSLIVYRYFMKKIRSWSIMGVEGLIMPSYPFIQLNFVYMY